MGHEVENVRIKARCPVLLRLGNNTNPKLYVWIDFLSLEMNIVTINSGYF